MMVLVSYDVAVDDGGAKRLRQVARCCINFGHRVQNSVFECVLTEVQFIMMKNDISKIIDSKKDSVRFYFLGKNWPRRIEIIGKNTTLDIEGDLII